MTPGTGLMAAGIVAAGAVGVGLGIVTVDGGEATPTTTVEATIDTTTPPAADGSGGAAGATFSPPAGVVRAPMYDCPGGTAVGVLHSGDRVVATAVDESRGWVAVRDPLAPRNRVWLRADLVVPDAGFDSLPAEPCDRSTRVDAVPATTLPGETSTVPDSTVPESTVPGSTVPATTTAPGSTAPPATPPPPTTPPPTSPPSTPAPDTTGPTISASTSPTQIWETYPGLCGTEPKQSTISASATDPSGIASITATWTFAGGATRNLGTGGSTVFGPFATPPAVVPDNGSTNVTITIRATDGVGNTSQRTLTVTVTSAATCFG